MLESAKATLVGTRSGLLNERSMKTRPLLLGLVIPITTALLAPAHAHTGAGISIVGPVVDQAQQPLQTAVPVSEIIFLLAAFLLAIRLSLRLHQTFSPRIRARLVGGLMIAVLALGIIAYALPSHEVSITPPVSFSFFFGGDTGYYSGSLAGAISSNRLIQPDFFLDLGDISYNGTTNGNPATGNEADWCNFVKANVQNRLSNSGFPYLFVTGNHEDGTSAQKDGYIDAFIGNNCLPLSEFNSKATAGDGYINFIGSGLCSESLGPDPCYGKEGYFDYPAANPVARIITLTVADTVGNSSSRVNFNYCPLEDTSRISGCNDSTMDQHWTWLNGTISSAKNTGLWIIVAFHKPCLSPAFAIGCEGNGATPNGHNANYQLENYLMSKGVDVILNGHVHLYARSKQLTCLGPTEPESDSKTGITYSPACVANDGSSGVYERGMGTVDVIQGVFSQRDDQLNFTRPDINFFAKAMSARGPTLNDCCWVYGSPMNMTSGNGIGRMTVNATQISFDFLPSVYSHTVAGASKFADSFVIRSPSSPTNSTSPPPRDPSLLLLASSIAAAILAVAIVSVFFIRRRKKGLGSQPPTFQVATGEDKLPSIHLGMVSLRYPVFRYSDAFWNWHRMFKRIFPSRGFASSDKAFKMSSPSTSSKDLSSH